MRLLSLIILLVLKDPVLPQAILEPARISCDAAFSAPCARRNAEWLAIHAATEIAQADSIMEQISLIQEGAYNMETGFYPFAFDTDTGECLGHGAHPEFVGMHMNEIFEATGLHFSDGDAAHERFTEAAVAGGDWVNYLWNDSGRVNSKFAYCVNVTDKIYLGVGYEDQQLPLDLPCSDKYASWCSIKNIRSLLGKSQLLLEQAESLAQFEAAIYKLSYDEEFDIPEAGFYTFTYSYDGTLKAHPRQRDSIGKTMGEIYFENDIGLAVEGDALHEMFILAAEGANNGWVQYQWRNNMQDDTFTKVAFIIKVEFEGEMYYVGSGFSFDMGEVALGPGGEECPDTANLPCALQTALQLSAFTLVHAISHAGTATEMAQLVTADARFRRGSFYTFIYDYEGECLAHGATPGNVGLTLPQIYEKFNIDLNGAELHQTFIEAADRGGGYVRYDWLDPEIEGSDFQKVSYIFKIHIDGRDMFGGVGFENKRGPTETKSEIGRKYDSSRIDCTRDFFLHCAEENTSALTGDATAEATLSSSEAGRNDRDEAASLDIVLDRMTSGEEYRLNDFFVMAFSFDHSNCITDDGSGCCVAHGEDQSKVGLTWQEILNQENISSISGVDLHSALFDKSGSGGGSVEYPWSSEFGVSRTKRSWVARFRNGEKDYYVVSEYFKTPLPPTCDACPRNMECKRADQSFCDLIPPAPFTQTRQFAFLMSAMCFLLVATLITTALSWHKKKQHKTKVRALKLKVERMASHMKQHMQGMYEVTHNLPMRDPEQYSRSIAMADDSTQPVGVWYWEEDESYVNSKDPSLVLTGTNFVQYVDGISGQLDHAFHKWKAGKGDESISIDLTDKIVKASNAHTGCRYEINFATSTQQNEVSDYQRKVRRVEQLQLANPAAKLGDLPPLPEDISFGEEAENLLPTVVGQVIQVSKVHPDDKWLFGNVLYDPLLDDAQGQSAATTNLNSLLMDAIHDRPTSGWFPKEVVKEADVPVMEKLLGTIGDAGADTLAPPPTFDGTTEGTVKVPNGSPEYKKVKDYFLRALHGKKARVVTVERVQNTPLWQTYAVKRQTMKTRDEKQPGHIVNNADVEREWLFHGSSPENIPKIVKQGFNRAFAGENGVAYGKGVYFARDSRYSYNKTYSKMDSKGVQRMFMCQVAVGDYCQGVSQQLTPNPKPHNALELYDSTVDLVRNPSIFVVYHDSQAYPSYIISFKAKPSE